MGYVYLVVLLGFMAALGGTWFTAHSSGVDAGVTKQKQVDDPKIAKLEADLALTEAAKKTSEANVATLKTEVETCNGRVDKLKTASDEAIRRMDEILRASEERKQEYEKIVGRYRAAAKAPRPVPPDQSCDVARGVLRELADQMRGDAPSPPDDGGRLSISSKPPPKSAITTVK